MHALPPKSQILIVDDDAVTGELLLTLLSVEGHGVTHAYTGAEALDLAAAAGARFDLILCDIHMPGLNGNQLASALLSARNEGNLHPGTLLVGMSGSTGKSANLELFDGFLTKPFTLEELARVSEQARARSGYSSVASAESGLADESSVTNTEKSESSAGESPLDELTFSRLRSKLPDDQVRLLYEMTLDDVRARLERMSAAAENGDEAAVRQEAHTIKGSCGMVGAVELQALAAATEGGSALDTSALADFAAACQRLQRMLDERL
jgi:CheY-like chemotaxis protein